MPRSCFISSTHGTLFAEGCAANWKTDLIGGERSSSTESLVKSSLYVYLALYVLLIRQTNSSLKRCVYLIVCMQVEQEVGLFAAPSSTTPSSISSACVMLTATIWLVTLLLVGPLP